MDATPCELVLSANGQASLFDLVDAVVASAPRVDEWVFIALKPPTGFAFRTKYEGVEYNPDAMWFLPLESQAQPSAIGIRVGLPDYVPSREQEMRDAVTIILRTALGERSAALDIEYLDICSLPEDPTDEGFIELRELAEYIEWKKSKK